MPIELDFIILGYVCFMNIIILIGLYNLKNEIVYLQYKNKEFEKRTDAYVLSIDLSYRINIVIIILILYDKTIL